LDLGPALRALRRSADLSQRQLAARSGVSQAAIARIESGRSPDPSFRTVERLARAAGGAVVLTTSPAAEPVPVEPVPQELLRDAAGRRYPAHLDIEEVTRPEKWWGSWWTLTMIESRWPLERVPPYTFDRRRPVRDHRRERAARGRAVAVRRAVVPGLSDRDLLWVAEAAVAEAAVAGGTARVGELRAHRESTGRVVVDGVVVAPEWRRCGIGRRLIEAVRAEASGSSLIALAIGPGEAEFLKVCGFRRAGVGASRWMD
jgi:transcriptional regulator with XRE-family HTH domain